LPKWSEAGEVTITAAEIAFKHDGCLLTKLSEVLPANYRLDPNIPRPDKKNITAFFSTPEIYTHAELGRIFGQLNGKLTSAKVRMTKVPKPSSIFEITFRDTPLHYFLSEDLIRVDGYNVTPDCERVNLRMIGITPNQLRDKMGDSIQIIEQQYQASLFDNDPLLTNPAQTKLISYLIDKGFYSLPKRGITLEQAATDLGVSDSQLSLQIRDINGRILREYVRKVRTPEL
jgi:hypothetical protein